MDLVDPRFFSVIIPAYNREKYIRQCIQSVLDQINIDFEVIVVNDGCTDGTVSILNEFETHSQVRIIHQENLGRCIARNRGLDVARGQWICFLDSDDIFLPNHLEVFSLLIESLPQYKAFSTELTCSGKTRLYPNKRYAQGEKAYTFKDFIRNNFVSLNQLCVKKDICPRFPNSRMPISEDWLFMRKVVYQTSIYKSSTVTTDVRMHDERTMEISSRDDLARYNVIGAELFCRDVNPPSSIKHKIMAHAHLLAANELLSNGFREKGRKQVLKSWSNFPHNIQKSLLNAYFKIIFKSS